MSQELIEIIYIHPQGGYTHGIGFTEKGDIIKVTPESARQLIHDGRSQFWRIHKKAKKAKSKS